MITLDMSGKVVLVTGGTMGIGLASALKFAEAGAQTILTYRWGTANEDEINNLFTDIGAPKPLIIEADVSNSDDTEALLNQVKQQVDGIDIFISNVAFALLTKGVDEYEKRSLFSSIEYTAWPMWAYSKAINETFGCYPKYIIGLSSDGVDSFFLNYDFVAIAKAVMETMCRYMNYRLRKEGVNVNIVRGAIAKTESYSATFGEAFPKYLKNANMEDCFVTEEEIASVVFTLCSGLLDIVRGQVLHADNGAVFYSNIMGGFEHSDFFSEQKKG